jgi:hypothetical protein
MGDITIVRRVKPTNITGEPRCGKSSSRKVAEEFWGSLYPKVDVFSMFGMFGIIEITKCGDIDIKFHQPH